MLTPGESNAQQVILLSVCLAVVVSLASRVWTEIVALVSLLTPQNRIVILKNVSSFRSEVFRINFKHLNEYITIFSVKDIPKIPLKQLHAIDPNSVVTVVNEKVQIDVEPSRSIRLYTQVPMLVLKEALLPEEDGPSDRVGRRPTWLDIVTEVLGIRRAKTVGSSLTGDVYYSIEGRRPLESVGKRFDRLLSRFNVSVREEFEIDSRTDSAHPVVPLVALFPFENTDGLWSMSLFHGAESLTVFFDPHRSELVAYSMIPAFYGIEEETCTICCDARIDTLLVDCFHCSTCENCANSLRDGRCPICRKSVVEKIIIPLS